MFKNYRIRSICPLATFYLCATCDESTRSSRTRPRAIERAVDVTSRSMDLAHAVTVVLVVLAVVRGVDGRAFPESEKIGTLNDDRGSRCRVSHASVSRVADDRGRSCEWYDVDTVSGCCPTTSATHSCEKCDAAVECCERYETCVSCCLAPARRATLETEMRTHARGRNQVVTGFFDDPFDFCANRCRTQPSVTLHENEYAYSTKHCFGDYPKNEDPVPVKGQGKKSFAGDSPDES